MSSTDIDTRLANVFRTVFKNPTLELSDTTTARDVPGWDSLAHISLISEIEGEFGIKFKLKELMNFENVGDLRRLVVAKAG